MKPVNQWVIVELVKEEEKTEGGIILTTIKRTSPLKKFKVIDISPDVYDLCREDKQDLRYGEGSIVYSHFQTGIPVELDNKDNNKFFIKYDAVMAVE